MRNYYALSDWFTGDDPKEYTSGFANTKTVICFDAARERACWLESTKLLTARALTQKQAIKAAKWETGPDRGKIKIAYPYMIDKTKSDKWVILGRKSHD